jgi:4-amino-4-deoxy-L-arabinose transferase-like glycosyltransferase
MSAIDTVTTAPRRRLAALLRGEPRQRDVLIGVSLLAALLRAPLLWDRYEPRDDNDVILYLHLADRLVAGLHFPSDFRAPGYPLFLTLGHLLPGRLQDMDILLQHVLGVGVAAGMVALGWRYFGAVAGTLAGVVAATTPVLVDTEHNLIPDFLFGAAVLGASVLLLETLRRPFSYRRLALVGAAFGLIAYIKPNGQAFVIAALVPLAFATRDVRRTLAGAVVFAAAAVATLVPWMARNAVEYGHFSFSSQGGQVLFLRVFDEDGLPIPTDTAAGRLTERIYVEGVAQATPGQALSMYGVVLGGLEKRGMTESEASAVMQDVAKTAIERHPVRYAVGTVKNMGLMVARSFSPRYPIAELQSKLQPQEFPRAVAMPLWLGGALVDVLFMLASLAGLTVIALWLTGSRETRLTVVTLGWIWVLVAATVSLFNWPSHRFATQGLPLYLLLSAAGIVAGAKLLQARRAPARSLDQPA